jgi:hypothetical protein
MTLLRRAALKTHVSLCPVCGKFHKDIMRMQWCVDELRRREESDARHSGQELTDGSRARMQKAMEEARAAAKQAAREGVTAD